jgi:hypothetical protein
MRSAARPLPHEAGGKSGPESHCNGQKAHFSAMAIFAHPLEKFRACLPPEPLEPPGGDARVVDGVLWVAMAEVILD